MTHPIHSAVHVCFDRDIECGDLERNWCDTCPKRKPIHSADAERELQKAARAMVAAFNDPTCSLASLQNYATDLSKAAAAQVGANGAADCATCHGSGVIGTPGAKCPFCSMKPIAAGAPAAPSKPVCQGMLAECPTCKNDISKCVGMGQGKQRYAMSLADPAATIGAGEGKDAALVPVLYQVRMRPDWDENIPWQEWKDCSEGSYHDHKRLPHYNNWHYEVRALAEVDAAMRSKTSPGEAG